MTPPLRPDAPLPHTSCSMIATSHVGACSLIRNPQCGPETDVAAPNDRDIRTLCPFEREFVGFTLLGLLEPE